MFGSIRRFTFNSDDMSISVSSWRKLFIAVSLIALDLTYFCRFIVFSEITRFTIHGRWSDIWLSIMEDEMATCFFMRSFAEYLINEASGVPRKFGGRRYFRREIICAHQVKKFAIFCVRKFVINLYWNRLQSLHTCFRFRVEVSPL